ncbi:V-type ATP synthase subunit E [Sulfuracidifex metallicus]|uniref:V-type ATP synthase subunit E n=1 Tax=Sulfuracidifex metallicus TaxID=47303 RepID=UPI002272F06C|nr:V-type ATP synthase subunit E [Sulfuracidifex metallicus]MCY0849974.1 V-type ATP synthase subunit E [Sulfuracidifex metallicus]
MQVEELFNRVVKEDLEDKAISQLDKALEQAKKIVENNHRKIEAEYLEKVEQYIRKSKEEIEGEKAKLEVENKRAILSEKEFWINKVYQEALNMINKVTSAPQYKEAMKGILQREVKSGNLVYCSKKDLDLVRSILKGLDMNAEVQETEMLGGVKVLDRRSGEIKDYSLKLFLDQVFDNMRGKLSDVLFGDI